MAFNQQRENSGILFHVHEDNKRSDRAPDWTGKVNVGGTTYELAAWEKEAKNGNTFLSLKVSEASRDDSGVPF